MIRHLTEFLWSYDWSGLQLVFVKDRYMDGSWSVFKNDTKK
jgi:hypothetical protein